MTALVGQQGCHILPGPEHRVWEQRRIQECADFDKAGLGNVRLRDHRAAEVTGELEIPWCCTAVDEDLEQGRAGRRRHDRDLHLPDGRVVVFDRFPIELGDVAVSLDCAGDPVAQPEPPGGVFRLVVPAQDLLGSRRGPLEPQWLVGIGVPHAQILQAVAAVSAGGPQVQLRPGERPVKSEGPQIVDDSVPGGQQLERLIDAGVVVALGPGRRRHQHDAHQAEHDGPAHRWVSFGSLQVPPVHRRRQCYYTPGPSYWKEPMP